MEKKGRQNDLPVSQQWKKYEEKNSIHFKPAILKKSRPILLARFQQTVGLSSTVWWISCKTSAAFIFCGFCKKKIASWIICRAGNGGSAGF